MAGCGAKPGNELAGDRKRVHDRAKAPAVVLDLIRRITERAIFAICSTFSKGGLTTCGIAYHVI